MRMRTAVGTGLPSRYRSLGEHEWNATAARLGTSDHFQRLGIVGLLSLGRLVTGDRVITLFLLIQLRGLPNQVNNVIPACRDA
jgi:hypothetical protein